jgi:hypothetical protein
MNIIFSSRASKQCRPALEELMFFNPRQFRVREGIINSLARFGHPKLVEVGDYLTVRIGNQEAQTLFAYDRNVRDDVPVGMIVFLRTAPEELAILHVAVLEDYSLRGRHGELGLGLMLMDKVKEIALRIVGIKKIIFFYRQEVVVRF